ncbi:MAG: hypothetical protein AMXMBFR61_09200 [Fimbriimonadales bacterium]
MTPGAACVGCEGDKARHATACFGKLSVTSLCDERSTSTSHHSQRVCHWELHPLERSARGRDGLGVRLELLTDGCGIHVAAGTGLLTGPPSPSGEGNEVDTT